MTPILDYQYPPNIDIIKERFDIESRLPEIVFPYKNVLYNPSGNLIDEHLRAHEETHIRQQGDDSDLWWNGYIEDTEFRLSQEIEAYQNHYRSYCKKNKDKNDRIRFLHYLAKDLSSPIYDNMIGRGAAIRAIRAIRK